MRGVIRDARRVAHRADRRDVGDLDVFAAMYATALRAAELALQRVGAHSHVTLLADMDGRPFVSRAVTDHLFAVAVVDARDRSGSVNQGNLRLAHLDTAAAASTRRGKACAL